METLAIAAIAGPIMSLVGIGIFANKKYYQDMMKNFAKDASAAYVGGILASIIGLVILLQHGTSWTLDAAGLITVFAFAALAEGAVLLVAPGHIFRLSTAVAKNENMLHMLAGISVLAGFYLSYIAYFVQITVEVTPAA